MFKKKWLPMFSLFGIAILLNGCTSIWQGISQPQIRKGASSSLVDYLYPNGEIPPKYDSTIPHLSVPLRVGLAFVPNIGGRVSGLSEAEKSRLLQRTSTAFSDKEYISEIVIIPDTYLRSSRGFKGLEQVSRLYGVDVVALVSYDQLVHTEDNRSAIWYWTIIGAYLVEGSQNDIQTFVDTAIFDISTRKLLFRAPGVYQAKEKSNLIDSQRELRENRSKGFDLAMADMTANLEKELESFRSRIKKDNSVRISYKPNHSGGGGSMGLLFSLILASALFFRTRTGKTVQDQLSATT